MLIQFTVFGAILIKGTKNEWFEKEANQVALQKDALEDRLVELYKGWDGQIRALLTTT